MRAEIFTRMDLEILMFRCPTIQFFGCILLRFLNVYFLFLSLLLIPLPKREYNAVSAIANEIWQYRGVETSRY